jgi:hypothetical protein
MSEADPGPPPYRVAYSERVRTELRDLLNQAVTRGLGRQALDAVKAIDTRLRVYPQFGEPLYDLKTGGKTVWMGTIPPLVVQYVLDEEQRQVFVVVPVKPLPGSGL